MIDIIEFARDVLNIELSPFQEEMLRQLEKGDRVFFMTRKPGRKTIERIWEEYKQFKKLRADE